MKGPTAEPSWLTSLRILMDVPGYHSRVSLVGPEFEPCDDARAAYLFTTTDQMGGFLAKQRGGSWKIDLVADREGLVVAIADLHHREIRKLCLDPEPDGSGGKSISLADAMVQCAR